MINQLFLLIAALCLHCASSTLRIRFSKSLINEANVLKGLSDNSIVIGYDKYLELLSGKNYTDLKQRIELSDKVQDYNIFPSENSLIYLQNGQLKLIIGPDKQQSLILHYQNQPRGSSFSQMTFYSSKMMFPPMDKSLTIYSISQNISVNQINATFVLQMDFVAGTSNLAFNKNGQFLIFVVPYVSFYSQFTQGLIYKGRMNSLTYDNVYNISDPFGRQNNDRAMFFYRKLANLQIISETQEDKFFLAWQSIKSDYFQMNLMLGNSESLTKYSSIQMQSLKTVKYMNRESILTYSTVDCQIQNHDPTNPIAMKKMTDGLQNSVLVKTISNDQTKMIAVLTNTTRGNFFESALLYEIDGFGSFHKKESLVLTRPSAFGFGSSAFMGNNEYFVILQKSTTQNDPRMLLYSIQDRKFSTESYIKGVFAQQQNGLFCVSKDSQSLIVLQREIDEKLNENFSFNYYQLIDRKLSLFDSIPLNSFSRTRNLSCIGERSFIWGLFNYDSFVLSLYKVNSQNKIQFVKQAINSDVGYYKISGVMNDVLMIFSRLYSLSDHQVFYDANLTQIFPLFVGIKYFYLQKLVDFRNGKLLIQTKSAHEVWSMKQGNFFYEGGFPLKVDIYYKSSFYKTILLPLHNILYFDYSKRYLYQRNAIYFDLNKPARKRIVGAGFGDTQCRSTQNIKTQWTLVKQDNQSFMIVKKTNLNVIEKYKISSTVQLVDMISVDFISSSTRLSADQTNLIIWGNHSSGQQIVEVRDINNLSKVSLSRRFSNLKYFIQDCDYNSSSELLMVTTKFNNQISVFIYQNSTKIIQKSSSIDKVQLFAFSKDIIAYTGIDSSTQKFQNVCIFHPLMKVKEQKYFHIQCKPLLLEVSPKGISIAGVCLNNIFVYNTENQSIKYIAFEGIITQIRFLSQSRLAYNLNNKIIISNLDININKLYFWEEFQSSANTSIAVDLKNQLIAFSSNSTNIILANNTGNIIEHVQTPNGESVIALTFNSEGELIVSTDGPSLFIWTSEQCMENETVVNNYCECRASYFKINFTCICPNNLKVIDSLCACDEGFIEINNTCFCPNSMIQRQGYCVCSQTYIVVNQTCVCPNNLTIIDGYCSCKATFEQVEDYCICPDKSKQNGDVCSCPDKYQLNNAKCQCAEGFIEDGETCIQRECSFLCQQCNSLSLLDCSSFGVWSFVILGGLTIILGFIVAFCVIKIKRKRKEKLSQFTEEISQESSKYQAISHQ